MPSMNTKEAVAKRILQLCEERNLAVNALANLAGIAPSTVYSMLNEKSQNPGVVSIKKICDGMDISVREFLTATYSIILSRRSNSKRFPSIC